MGYKENTISSIVEAIDQKQILLPAIQRKYVWTENQITKLMDSIMKDYPFGTFLFWKVKKSVVVQKAYSMYEFIKDFHERDNYQNPKAGQLNINNSEETILTALDGQQRLTSLYIALKGTLAYKLPKKHWDNNDAFPKKELYFNLLSKKKNDDEEISYIFKFLTQEEAAVSSNEVLWYKVKEILQYPELKDINRLILTNGWAANETITDNIALLFQQIKSNKLISYFEVETECIDDVLDIFVRLNSGGTVLSKTDLLFSTMVSYWDEGREEIDSFLTRINKIGDHYKFSNDFIMRTCLYVLDMPVSLKVETFGKENVNKIKDNWKSIYTAIEDTVNLLNQLGFSSENIVADNAIIPIIFYRYQYGFDAFENTVKGDEIIHNVKFEIKKFLIIAQIKHIFGQSTNETLKTIRNEMKNHTGKFKLSDLQALSFVGDRNLKYTEDDIEDWFDCFEKNEYTFMILSLLYPNLKYGQNKFHQDHVHPHSAFEKREVLLKLILPGNIPMTDDKVNLWRHQRNTLANLQLLEGGENESKNKKPLAEWLKDDENKKNIKFLPEGIDYSLLNFDEFLAKRKALMLKELKKLLFENKK